jgi:hypothetical protein
MPLQRANETELYYELRGNGPAILLIMGATGDGGAFARFADFLAYRGSRSAARERRKLARLWPSRRAHRFAPRRRGEGGHLAPTGPIWTILGNLQKRSGPSCAKSVTDHNVELADWLERPSTVPDSSLGSRR